MSKKAIQNLIANSFIVIRDFIAEHLGQDPKTLLGEDAWNTLISVSEVYEREKAECLRTIDAVDWKSEALASALTSFTCGNCGSGLIKIDDPQSDPEQNAFVCKACGKEWDYETAAEEAIQQYSASENYMSVADGGDPITITCPGCFRETYIFAEQKCPVCGEEAEHECQRCGADILPEELDGSGFCGWCAHMLSKDD